MTEASVDHAFIRRAVSRHADMLLRIAWQQLGSRADAEDVTQEAFVRLLRQPPFDSEEHVKAWLIRVTLNLCRDILKSAGRRRTVSLTEEWPTAADDDGAVLQELWLLPERDRAVLHLFYVERYTTKEIAALLDTKEGTVCSRLARARRKLRSILEEGEGYV